MKTILLTQGKVALVDDADYAATSQFKWHAQKSGRCWYAKRNVLRPDGKQTTQYLHQFLIPGVPEIDHEDGNGLNNQRYNLRPCSHKENVRAFQNKRGDTSSFRGVSWNKARRKWQASIYPGRTIYLGLFISEIEAARARDTAALKHFGEIAQLNFPV